MIEAIEKSIKELAKKADSENASEALHFSQAAVNLANTRASFLLHTPKEKPLGLVDES